MFNLYKHISQMNSTLKDEKILTLPVKDDPERIYFIELVNDQDSLNPSYERIEPATDTSTTADSTITPTQFYPNKSTVKPRTEFLDDFILLLLGVVTAALIIVIIALAVNRIRKKHNEETSPNENAANIDPYIQAIMIPKDPPPEWHKSLKFVIQKAGHKIIGKSSDTHQTTIPEHLKYQLKQIYVY